MAPPFSLLSLSLLATALISLPAATAAPVRSPFYADPLFDGAHDAEFVWHDGEGCWWLIYLQNRYNSPLADPAGSCAYCVYTDIGLASTPDQGKTWIYRGVARGLDVPAAVRVDPLPPNSTTQQFGGATWWRPAVFRHAGQYHGYFVYNTDPNPSHKFPSVLPSLTFCFSA